MMDQREDHPCFISDDEWDRYGASTGKDPEVLASIRVRHARELANVDPDFFPDDEHRVAYQRGLIDAVLKHEWPRDIPRCAPKRRVFGISRCAGPRICWPAAVISQAVQAVLRPVVLAGPELHKRLQPRFERLCDIESPALATRIERAALRWLLEEPEIEPDTTEDRPRPLTEHEAELIADLEAWHLRRAAQKLASAGATSMARPSPSSLRDTRPDPGAARNPEVRGAR